MYLREILALHKKWLNGEDGGSRAKLRGADLRGADLDFSCLPLWCGSLKMTVDRRLSAQIAYHFCSLRCEDPEVVKFQELLYGFANTFHRVGEVPKLEVMQNEETNQ